MLSKITGFLIINLAYILPATIFVLLVVSQNARTLGLAILRTIARPLLLLAVVAMVYDGTRTLAGGSGIVITSLADHLSSFAPASMEALRQQISKLGYPVVWDVGFRRLLMMPAWLVIGVLGVMLAYLGRRRHQVRIFIN